MANSADAFSVSFTADLADLRRGLAEANQRLNQTEAVAERAGTRAGSALQRGGQMGATAMLRMAAASAVAIASFQNLSQLARATANLDDAAEAAGLTTTKFQELAFAARGAGLEQSAFAAALANFSTTMAEFRARQGDFYQFIQQANPALAAQLRATKDQSEALIVIAEAVRRMDKAENAALLTKKAMGEGGVKLVKVLREGKAGFEEAAVSAQKFGAVVNEEAIKKVDAMTTAAGRFGDAVKANFVNAIAAAAPTLERFFNQAAKYDMRDLSRGTRSAAISKFQGSARGTVQDQAQSMGPWTTTVDKAETIAPKVDFRPMETLMQLERGLKAAQEDRVAMIRAEEAGELLSIKKLAAESVLSAEQVAQARSIISATTEEKLRSIRRESAREMKALDLQVAQATGESFRAIGLEYERDLEQYQEALRRKAISTEDFENARVALNKIAGEKIKAAMKAEADKVREITQPIEQAISGSIGGALSEAFQTGTLDVKKFFAQLAASVAQAAIQMAAIKPIMDSLFSGAPGSLGNGIAGSLGLLPARAEGGSVTAGQPYMIGERKRAEVFVPDTSGRVVPAERFGASGGGGGGNVYHIDARETSAGVEARIMRALAQLERGRPDPVAQAQAYSRRFPAR